MLEQANQLVRTLQESLGLPSGSYALVEVRSTVDSQIYKVRNLPDKQAAADLLARVRLKLKNFIAHLQSSFPDKPQVKRIQQRFEATPERLLEATPDAEHTSYSVNKGEKVHLCLRQRQGADESLVNENIMVFVALHEMAHVVTDSVGHGPDFWNNFGWLLKEAEKTTTYQYTDFKAHPVRYCGTKITDAPAYNPQKDGSDMTVGQITLD